MVEGIIQIIHAFQKRKKAIRDQINTFRFIKALVPGLIPTEVSSPVFIYLRNVQTIN